VQYDVNSGKAFLNSNGRPKTEGPAKTLYTLPKVWKTLNPNVIICTLYLIKYETIFLVVMKIEVISHFFFISSASKRYYIF